MRRRCRCRPAPQAEINVDARPLSGVRVLDFTRIIAGPVAGRTLAAHGADVLLVTAAHLPSIPPLVIDTGRGKRSCQLDLRDADDKRALHKLLHGADVVVQGYRPNGLAELGSVPPPRRARVGHRLCVAICLWPCRAVGGQAWFRFARADGHRLQ
jgi:hypothetical protein